MSITHSQGPRAAMDRDAVVRLGQKLQREISQKLELEALRGNVIAIDVVSGDYELARDQGDIDASDRLRKRHPDAVIFLGRVGRDAFARFQSGPP